MLHLDLFLCQAMVLSAIFRFHLPVVQAVEKMSAPI